MIYISIFILLIILSLHFDLRGKKGNRDICYYGIMVVFILVAGLRYRLGTDTPNYIWHFYHDIPKLDRLTVDDISIGNKTLWILLNSLILSLGGKFYMVQLIQTTFVNVLIFRYIKKHSNHLFTCLFFYFLCMYFSLNMEVMKAALSIVVCYYANDYVLRKKWLKAYSLFAVAILFHPQALLISFVSIFYFLRFNKLGFLVLAFSFVVGIVIQSVFGDYLMLFEFDDALADKTAALANNEHTISQDHSQIYLSMAVYVYIVYALISFFYIKQNVNSNLLEFEPFLFFFVLFYVVSINAFIFYRFSMYYMIYLILFISDFFVNYIGKRRKVSFGVAYFKSFVIILPFIVLVGYFRGSRAYRYYPYSSVIERSVDKERESRRLEDHPNGYAASPNEY